MDCAKIRILSAHPNQNGRRKKTIWKMDKILHNQLVIDVYVQNT